MDFVDAQCHHAHARCASAIGTKSQDARPHWLSVLLMVERNNSRSWSSKFIDVPTLIMHGEDDQIVPIAVSAPRLAKLLKKGILKVYEQFPPWHVHHAC
jgi:pimeloyl-ACP methyl ester carboxylesterase